MNGWVDGWDPDIFSALFWTGSCPWLTLLEYAPWNSDHMAYFRQLPKSLYIQYRPKKKKKEEEIKNFKSAKKSQNKYENRVWVIIYQKRETTWQRVKLTQDSRFWESRLTPRASLFSRSDGYNGQKMSYCFPDSAESISSPQQHIQMQGPSINKSKVAMMSILSEKF